MEFDWKGFQKELAEQKVYDAWQYVNSLQEMLTYMDMSCVLVEKVYARRKEQLHSKEQEIFCEAAKNGSAEITEDALHCTDLNIAGITIDDRLFLQKTTMEFFHYARTSIDILFQIINAALLGDQSLEVDDKYLLKKVNDTLEKNDNFKNLKSLLDANKKDDTFKYIQDFDNYIKHIKTVLITVKNSFMIGNQDEFTIRAFVNGQSSYSEKDAVTIVRDSDCYVHETVVHILTEVKRQLPNCLDNSQRVHDVLYKLVVKESNDKTYPDYLSFFIEIQNDLSDLKSEIKVLPLIVKPNGEIQSSDFRFDTIFIRKAGTDEFDVIGCAKIKNGFNTNELYRTFTVEPCGREEYIRYIGSFKQEHPKFHFSSKGMQGSIIVHKD